MDIELKPLRAFVALAEELSFSRAAVRMHVTQPALSAQIRELERRLGFALFNRTTRQVQLTVKGRALLVHARRLVEDSSRLQHAVEELRGAGQRRLRLGAAFYTINIPERVALLESFFAHHPEIPLDVSPAWQNTLLADLQRGALDIALLLGLAVPRATYLAELAREPAVEILIPDDLPKLLLRQEAVGLLIPRELAIAGADPLPLAALRGLRVAMLGPVHGDPVTGPILRLLEAAGAEPVVPPEPHGIGVERYGRQFRIPAVTLGWFGGGGPGDDSMVRCSLEGLRLTTELSVVGSPVSSSPALATLWREVSLHIAGGAT